MNVKSLPSTLLEMQQQLKNRNGSGFTTRPKFYVLSLDEKRSRPSNLFKAYLENGRIDPGRSIFSRRKQIVELRFPSFC